MPRGGCGSGRTTRAGLQPTGSRLVGRAHAIDRSDGPPGTRVIEFGCGRGLLERYFPEDARYFASDIVERGPDTVVCDLNASRCRICVTSICGWRSSVACWSTLRTWALARWLADLGIQTALLRTTPGPPAWARRLLPRACETRAERLHEQPAEERPAALLHRGADALCGVRRWTHAGHIRLRSEVQTDRVGSDDGLTGTPSV